MFEQLHKDMAKLGKGVDTIINQTLSVDTSTMPEDAKKMMDKLKTDLPGIKDRMMKSDNPMDIYKEIEKEWLSNL